MSLLAQARQRLRTSGRRSRSPLSRAEFAFDRQPINGNSMELAMRRMNRTASRQVRSAKKTLGVQMCICDAKCDVTCGVCVLCVMSCYVT